MNLCVLSGRLLKEPLRAAEGKVMKFMIATKFRFRTDEIKEGTSYVPCVLFDPPKEVEDFFAANAKGTVYCECSGRVNRSSYDGADGERRYSTEVVINPTSLSLRRQ